MSILTVNDINLYAKENPEKFVRECEEKFEQTVKNIAKRIKKENIRFVFLSGPSSSGKTTFCKLLSKSLSGKNHFDISLDDYYKRKEDMPRKTNNDYNFETINSLRLDALKRDFALIRDGREVIFPLVDFKTGKWIMENERVKIEKDAVVLIEGLHALNKKITGAFKNEKILKIFICPMPEIERKGHLISRVDLRFLRRAVRDFNYRNSDILNSFRMWGDVRAGEKQFMAKYKDNADYIFSTFLNYEPCVLKEPALELLYKVKKESPYYLRAKRLINIMEDFTTLDTEYVGENSLLNEFIKR